MAIDPVENGFRSLGRSATAGLIAGTLVGGLGGRIVMRVSAIASNSDGLVTEGGNRVGDITVGGSIALVIFGAIFGLIGGLFLFTAHPWLPGKLGPRIASFALVVPLLAGTAVVSAESRDFLVLDPPELNIAMFLMIFAVFGATAVFVDRRLDGVLPRALAGRQHSGSGFRTAGLAVPVVFPTLLLFADGETAGAGAFFLVMGIATVVRISRSPIDGWPVRRRQVLELSGYGALVAACLVGSVSLLEQISLIV